MKQSGIFLFSAVLATCIVFGNSSTNGQTVPSLQIKEASEPILSSSNGTPRSTKVQAIVVSSLSRPVDSVALYLSVPKYVAILLAKIGEVEVGRLSPSSLANQTNALELAIDAKESESALKKSQELSIWIIPSSEAAPDKTLDIGVLSLTSGDEKITFDAPPLHYRFGVLVRDSGWDSVKGYRIPGVVRSVKGALIAVYDARHESYVDLPANIDIGCSRSFDNGRTWEPMRIAMNIHGEDEKLEGVGDPAILVDPSNGRIWLAALWAHNGKSLAASKPGLLLGESGQFVVSYSDDEGATWSQPRNITEELGIGRKWRILFQGPGCGITTRDGKFVFPAQYLDEDGSFFSTIVWSDDHGKTWHSGEGARKSTCESQVVELNDGSLMLNMRNYGKGAPLSRSVAITKDMGKTWIEHETSCKALPCPICQASLITVRSRANGDKDNLLAFMNPCSTSGRTDMRIQLSEDEGKTWSRSLTLYKPAGFGYSSLTRLDANTIGALYETYGGLIYQTIRVEEIK